jgi:phage gpG-like protein
MIEIKSNVNDARMQFEELAKDIKNLRPVWNNFTIAYKKMLKENFEGDGSIFGEWPKVTAKTQKRKDRLGQGSKTLLATGTLKRAIYGDSQYFIYENTADSLTLGIKGLPYSNTHQFGLENRNIPQRAYFFTRDGNLPARAWNELSIIAEKVIEGHIKKVNKYVREPK